MTTFLGIDKDGWEIINSIATCLGVLATFAAVLVSLWLAQRPDRHELTGSAGVRMLVTPGEAEHQAVLQMEVINKGRRPAKITSVGWRLGKTRQKAKHFVQMTDRSDGMSSQLPVILDDGQEARWYHPLDAWLADVRDFGGAEGKANFDAMHFVFSTSVGGSYAFLIEPSLKDALKAAWAERAPIAKEG